MSTGTIILTVILAGVVVMIIRKLVKDKKKGTSPCCGGCAHCALSGMCHKKHS